MKIIYDSYQELYLVQLEDPEMVTWINTQDIVIAREKFIEMMIKLFNDAVCEALKD